SRRRRPAVRARQSQRADARRRHLAAGAGLHGPAHLRGNRGLHRQPAADPRLRSAGTRRRRAAMTPGAEPWTDLAHAPMPDGGELTLRHCAGIFEIRCNGWELMSNRAHRSEEGMARLACAGLGGAPRVLIGGLGIGYTFRAAPDAPPR